MSKIKMLLDVANDLHTLADSVQAFADILEGRVQEPEEPSPAQKPVTESQTIAPVVTIDQVRAVLAEKTGQGKTQVVKALLYKYDAGKLSGVKPEDYAALMEEAKKL